MSQPTHGTGSPLVAGGLGHPLPTCVAVSDMARKRKLYMRDAAYVIAIARAAQACKDHGWV